MGSFNRGESPEGRYGAIISVYKDSELAIVSVYKDLELAVDIGNLIDIMALFVPYWSPNAFPDLHDASSFPTSLLSIRSGSFLQDLCPFGSIIGEAETYPSMTEI